jgi:hypothetical protein
MVRTEATVFSDYRTGDFPTLRCHDEYRLSNVGTSRTSPAAPQFASWNSAWSWLILKKFSLFVDGRQEVLAVICPTSIR